MKARIGLLVLCCVSVAGCSNQDHSRSAAAGGPASEDRQSGIDASRSGEAKGGVAPVGFREQLLEIARTYEQARQLTRQTTAPVPLAELEDAVKRLRKNPQDKKAAEAVDRAMRRLKERPKPNNPE